MKAQELQIGDWLNLSDVDDDIIPCKVVEIRTYDLVEIQPNDTACDIVGYDMVRPLTITEDILRENFCETKTDAIDWNNGYHWHEYDYDGRFYLAYDCDEARVEVSSLKFEGVSVRIRYAHELQHVLRLCGFNDLADNFKI